MNKLDKNPYVNHGEVAQNQLYEVLQKRAAIILLHRSTH